MIQRMAFRRNLRDLNRGIDSCFYFCYSGYVVFKDSNKMNFTAIDQGLLLFYIAGGILAIAGVLLYIASKK